MNLIEEFSWTPSKSRIENSNLLKFLGFLNKKLDLNLKNYFDLHQFSITESDVFWTELLVFNQVIFTGDLSPANKDKSFSSYGWFDNVSLNFAENLLKASQSSNDNKVALNFVHESGIKKDIAYKDLKNQSGSLQSFLKDYLVSGDVLGAYMPNIPETVVAMLASSSLGAVFTSTSSDFGVEGVVDRFSQSRPKVIIAAIGYEYGGKYFDQTEKIIEIESRLPFIEKIILVDFLNKGINLSKFKNAVLYNDILKIKNDLTFLKLPFSHPLYIMYSSGTTGIPKCIVHSQGGTLLQHIKELGLHSDLTENKKIFFFTTCGWMMWNWLMSSLFFSSEIVLYEGSPAYPSPEYFFKIINREKINIFGTSPRFLKALEDTNADLTEGFESLETILSTGSPLLPEQYDYVYNKIKQDVLLASISGGTDIIGCFMLGNPILPVFRGEIQCIGLGMNVQALNQAGEPVIESEGELICSASFPSRPIYFLNDPNNEKLNAAYFNQNKNVWTHGDFVKITKRSGVIVFGRSDATLNPGGVRIGTAEIYRQTESLDYLLDSICVGRPVNGDVEIILFVKLKANEELTNMRIKEIKNLIKVNTTPRHVPKEIISVSDIPYTRSGKKVELAVARIISKREVSNLEAIANPECLVEFKKYQ